MAPKNRAERSLAKQAAMLSRRIPCPYVAGDTVFIWNGTEKRNTGEFMRYDRKRNRVFVTGRMIVKHMVKGDPSTQKPGGEVSTEMGIHVSNTALHCPHCSQPTQLRRRAEKSLNPELGRPEKSVTWVCRRCGAAVSRNRKA
ncbi:MAG: hypothetical protein LBQ79_05200 [Deltaproteobacteria bacterium]|jgi:ribosomal protein L24|nr:hypothetical protein [Deltaproteobacteria bacterium]